MKKSTNIGISITVAMLLAAVFLLRGGPNEHPDTLATETLASNESAKIEQAIALLQNQARSGNAERPKYHGCLKGSFSVISNLPDSLRSALFTADATYPTWLRFSNHSGHQADPTAEFRGLAIKLFDVPGDKLAHGSAPTDATAKNTSTHDFLLGSYPVFLSQDAQSYLQGLQALRNGQPLRHFLNPFNLQLNAYRISKEMFAEHTDLTSIRWWSVVPYNFNKGQAVKYSMRPCQLSKRNYGEGMGTNFLAERLKETMALAPLCYEFMVQIQSDSKLMPIEDPTTDWNDALAPFQPIALLSFPVQDINDEEHRIMCNNLRFQPWQALPAHQPLGEINRARREIYTELKQPLKP